MLNQAAVEALCSASYVENYINSMEDVPLSVQNIVTELRELEYKVKGNVYMVSTLKFLILANDF